MSEKQMLELKQRESDDLTSLLTTKEGKKNYSRVLLKLLQILLL